MVQHGDRVQLSNHEAGDTLLLMMSSDDDSLTLGRELRFETVTVASSCSLIFRTSENNLWIISGLQRGHLEGKSCWKNAQTEGRLLKNTSLMRHSDMFCVSVCVCVCLCRWRWLHERASCLCSDDLHPADGSVSQSLRSQSCPTLLLTPHLTADFLPAHQQPTKTHTHARTHSNQRQQAEAAGRSRDEQEGRSWCDSGAEIKTNVAEAQSQRERNILVHK